MAENQSHEDIFKYLASVQLSWFSRLMKRNFKSKVRRRWIGFYRKRAKFASVYRNNQAFLEKSIEAKSLISHLKLADCLTDVQVKQINRMKMKKGNISQLLRGNAIALLSVIRSTACSERGYSEFNRCLHRTNQQNVIKVVDCGGVVLKADVKSWRGKQIFANISSAIKLKRGLHEADSLIRKLKEEGIEIFDTFQNRHTVIWFWCRSSSSLLKLHDSREFNYLPYVIANVVNIPFARPTGTDAGRTELMVNIDRSQFRKEVASFSTIAALQTRLEVIEVVGVTGLRNKIYVLCRSSHFSTLVVFDRRLPFGFQEKYEIKEIEYALDIASSEIDNCLYVSDLSAECIWKIATDMSENENRFRVMKWLSTEVRNPFTLSVTNEGHLLMVNNTPEGLVGLTPRTLDKDQLCYLKAYQNDAGLHFSLQLPEEIDYPYHSVATSTGNFVIAYKSKLQLNIGNELIGISGVSEVTRYEQMAIIIRRFIAADEAQTLIAIYQSIQVIEY